MIFGFETLEVFQGDVQEIAGAARRVEDLDRAQAPAEVGEDRDGVGGLAGALQREGGGLHVGPILAERLDDGGDDEAFDVGAGRVVSAEGVALALIEGALQQRAEDGGLHIFPFGGGGEAEDVELLAVEREGFDGFEEAAIEAQDVLAEDGGEAAGVHGSPKGFDHGLEVRQIVAQTGEEVGEAVVREEVDVLGEEGEDAAHQERRDDFGGVILFEGSGEVGEVARRRRG